MLRKLVITAGFATAAGCETVPLATPQPAPVAARVDASEIVPASGTTVQMVSPDEQPLAERLPDRVPPTTASPSVDVSGGLTLAAVESLAIAHNPTLAQAQAQVEGTLGKALQAGLWPNPVLGYEAEQIGAEGTAGEFHGGFVQQEIITAQKRRVSREKYLARAQVAEFVALAQQHRVLNDIRRQYWRLAGATRLVFIHEQMVKNAQDRLVTTEEMFNVGQANAVDVRQARVRLRRVQLDLQTATNDRDRHRRELAALVGVELPPDAPTEALDATPAPFTWEASRAYTLAESPELLEANAKLGADRITLDRERRQPIPNVTLRGSPGYNFVEGRTVVNASASIRLPLWDRNQGTIRQAQADLARQNAELRRVELRLERDLAMHFRQYLTARQHIEAYRTDILPEVEKAYQARLEAYKERRETWPMVLDAQSELYQRQAEYVRNLVTWRESRTLIEGFLLTGGLDAPPNPTPPGHIDATPQPR